MWWESLSSRHGARETEAFSKVSHDVVIKAKLLRFQGENVLFVNCEKKFLQRNERMDLKLSLAELVASDVVTIAWSWIGFRERTRRHVNPCNYRHCCRAGPGRRTSGNS